MSTSPLRITSIPTKTTSITVRLNNGEISEGIDALRAFCSAVMQSHDAMPKHDAIADAMLKKLDRGRE